MQVKSSKFCLLKPTKNPGSKHFIPFRLRKHINTNVFVLKADNAAVTVMQGELKNIIHEGDVITPVSDWYRSKLVRVHPLIRT